MPPQQDKNKLDTVIAQAKEAMLLREKTYRERALKMFPPVCGKCGRDFSGKKLRELTVHHRNHNHDDNPPDGSNWELLCVYCHENEHSRFLEEDAHGNGQPREDDTGANRPLGDNPFSALGALLKLKNQDPTP